MRIIERFQVRGLPGQVSRVQFGNRTVDYWSAVGGSNSLLVAHDGQNVFDRRTATHRKTWEMAQSASRVSEALGIIPPIVIGVFHSSNKSDPWGRAKDLTPQQPFLEGVKPSADVPVAFDFSELRGDAYLKQITDEIIPTIIAELASNVPPANRAMIGSSMGGLATLYAIGKAPEQFHTGLALSTHWPIAGDPLVDALITALPDPIHNPHAIWMSHGTKGLDAKYHPFQKRADQLMEERGWRFGENFQSKVYRRSGHNERSWARYLDEPMAFWLKRVTA